MSDLNNTSSTRSLFADFLAAAQNLEASDAQWDGVADWCQSLQKLSQAKLQERAGLEQMRKKREDIEQLLLDLATCYAEAPEYFEWDLPRWKVQLVGSENLVELEETLLALRSALEQRAAVQVEATTLAKRKQLQPRLDSIEELVQQKSARVEQFFLSPDSPTPDEGEKEVKAQEQQKPSVSESPTANAATRSTSVLDTRTGLGRSFNPASIQRKVPNSTAALFDLMAEITPTSREPNEATKKPDAPKKRGSKATASPVPGAIEAPTPNAEKPNAPDQSELVTKDAPPSVEVAVSQEEASISRANELQAVAPEQEAPLKAEQVTEGAIRNSTREPAADAGEAVSALNACDTRLCALMEAGDFAGAYWNSLAQVSSGGTVEIRPQFLGAFAGAQMVRGEGEPLAQDLSELFLLDLTPRNEAEQLLQLSAALRPVLLAPQTSNAQGWLASATNLPATLMPLRPIVEAVQNFTVYGIALRAFDLDSANAAQTRKDAFANLSKEASGWLDSTKAGNIQHRRSSMVRQILADKEFKDWLKPVVKNDKTQLETTREAAKLLRDRDWTLNLIHRIDYEKVKKKTAAGTAIEGNARNQLFRLFEEAAALMEHWCRLCDEEKVIADEGGEDYIFTQVEALRHNLQTQLPAALALLEELAQPEVADIRAGAARLTAGALQLLSDDLGLEIEKSAQASDLKGWRWLSGESRLSGLLGRRLLLRPDLILDDELVPTEATMKALGELEPLKRALAEEVEGALEGWCRAKDFRFVGAALLRDWAEQGLLSEEAIARWTREIRARREEASDELRGLLAEANDALEQAVVDGILEDGASLAVYIAAITLEDTLDFRASETELARIRHEIRVEANRKREEQRQEWELIARDIENSVLSASERTRVRAKIEALLDGENYDPRVVDEHLAWVRELLDGGGNRNVDDLEKEQSSRRTRRIGAAVRGFWNDLPHIIEALDALKEVDRLERKIDDDAHNGHALGAPGRAKGAFDFASLTPERRREAAGAVRAWALLKSARSSKRATQARKSLPELFARFFDFTFDDADTAVKIVHSSPDTLFAEVTMESVVSSPIPQFGSLESGSYLVACFWDKPTPDRVAALIESSGSKRRNVLALYFGRLSETMREELAAECRSANNNFSLAVLDETLLFFLCLGHEGRFPTFLECALPLAYANPYATSQAGSVRPEMFFGRQAMVEKLQNPTGSCLVYGGRQLGKSALLRHAQREFERQHPQQFSWVIDINLLGLGRESAESLWFLIRDALIERKLLKPSETSDNQARIAARIREVLNRESGRRLLFLFDESDNFLDADSNSLDADPRNRFRVATQLRALMTETEHRFKVVFAGLHDVYRFQKIPNQPLAHYGTPICVGPLEARAAQDLIMRPMAALGFEFKSEDEKAGKATATPTGVLRILSYTNSHPGLLQIFCEKLLDGLMKRASNRKPPYEITQRDIENVYRLADMREEIRKRFDWTLALDPRYQAIAWSFIFEQLSERQNFARAFSLGESLNIAANNWPQAFETMEQAEMAGLLEELCGMGVLSRDRGGHFRLRSPNLVRLMGSHANIYDSLVALADRNADLGSERQSHHAPLDADKTRFSPLTYQQESTILPPRFGVSFIFASPANGLGLLPDALSGILQSEGDPSAARSRVEAIPPERLQEALGHPELLTAFLEDRYALNKNTVSRNVLWGRMPSASAGEMEALVEASLRFCEQRQKTAHRWARVVWIFEPSALWNWLQLPAKNRAALEERSGLLSMPRAWDEIGIRARFDALSVINTDDLCKRVKDATGGWNFWLDFYFDQLGLSQTTDAKSALELLERLFGAPSPTQIAAFVKALGWNCAPDSRQFWEEARALTGSFDELIPTELLPETPQQEAHLELLSRLQLLRRGEGEITLDPLAWRLLTPAS